MMINYAFHIKKNKSGKHENRSGEREEGGRREGGREGGYYLCDFRLFSIFSSTLCYILSALSSSSSSYAPLAKKVQLHSLGLEIDGTHNLFFLNSIKCLRLTSLLLAVHLEGGFRAHNPNVW